MRASTDPGDVRRSVADLMRGRDGMWRTARPRMTSAQRRVLTALANGDTLTIDQDGKCLLSGQEAACRLVEILIERGWVTEPLPALPLFGEPARPGGITELGRNALRRIKP